MVEAQVTHKRKISTPSEGYTCSICNEPGHWIQQCPQKGKRKKKNTDHVHTPGVDPSQADIDKARALQKLKPPSCFCGIKSRLKKVNRSNTGEESRAIGKYFFFCSKAKLDEGKCKFARPVDDHVMPNKQRICTFFAKNGSCKKGDKCMFTHEISESSNQKKEKKADYSKRICTFFAKTGSCKKGDECEFSHEIVEGSDQKTEEVDPSKTICTFFLKGFCKKGGECRFIHEIVEGSDQKKEKADASESVRKEDSEDKVKEESEGNPIAEDDEQGSSSSSSDSDSDSDSES